MVCQQCGESYDDNFKFCPYCGHLKAVSKALPTDSSITAKYEEAILQIKLLGKEELTDSIFIENRFGFIDRILDRITSKRITWNWREIDICSFVLESTHPTKGNYIAYSSPEFSAFTNIHENFFPSFVIANLCSQQGRKWAKNFIAERKNAWEALNKYLIRDGWLGITKSATLRLAPIEIDFELVDEDELARYDSYDRFRLYKKWEEMFKHRYGAGIAPSLSTFSFKEAYGEPIDQFLLKNYRYQRGVK